MGHHDYSMSACECAYYQYRWLALVSEFGHQGRVDIVKNTKIAIQVAKTIYDLVFNVRMANNCSIIGCHCANFLGFILKKVQVF